MERKIDDPSSVETLPERGSSSAPSFSTPSSSSSASRIASASEVEEGRFLPGTLLGGRYRIISLLGRGGMGEVYRATDLTLGQAVALKFLPEEAARNHRLLERFHGEVRIARQVSHPNVCRVYDIGEIEGLPFLSMEYVDGEDLASLLRRIGRLPADKAMEAARKICAGLAAAHDRGVIHRDLKPQNVMINKRGEVLILDFGLAAIADQLSGAEARNGTPAYMSPEQLRGAEVTAKSDIYALGLVLFELFTGKRPFEAKTIPQLVDMQESVQLSSMTSLAADVDPAVERTVRRCLDPDPAKRPLSPLAVAASLPGGDALAAALAAGETPSPEVVAASGATEGLPRKYSVPCLAAVALCLFGSTFLRQHTEAMMSAPLDYPPMVLAQKAREFAAKLGYPNKPKDSAYWMSHRDPLVQHLRKLPEPRTWPEWLASESSVIAEYRESLSPFYAEPFGKVARNEPPPLEPGMVMVVVDGNARLREFSAVPYKEGQLAAPVAPEAVFAAAGFDLSKFAEAPPDLLPQNAADQVKAWKGPHGAIPNAEVFVQVASWKGRVTQVKIDFPWSREAAQSPGGPGGRSAAQIVQLGLLALVVACVIFAMLLARRNWKLGRTDRRGAMRMAAARFVLALVVWCCTVHGTPGGFLVFAFMYAVGDALVSAGFVWLIYLALEPALRARWPHSIVTWNRLLAGKWGDAQVGAHILIGATVGSLLWIMAEGYGAWMGPANVLASGGALNSAIGSREWLAGHTRTLANALTGGLAIFFVIFGIRALVRKDTIAAIVAALLFAVANGGLFTSPDWKIQAVIYVGLHAVLMFALLRLGLVTMISAIFFINSINTIVLGTDWGTWFAPAGLATLLMLLGVAAYAFWRSLGSRDLLGDQEAAI